MNIAQLKKSSAAKFAKLTEEMTKVTQKQTIQTDERLWYPEVDKAGNGLAVIRFLPETAGEEIPFVRVYNHAFQIKEGKGNPWYIENCPTTLGPGHKCPVCEHNQALWAAGDKATVSKQKRQLSFYSNILVIKDPATKENEGKVFIFRYGKRVYDKLKKRMEPDELDTDFVPINPFDPWTGANFRLKIRLVEKRRNYDDSVFDAPSVLGSDKEIEAIWAKQYPLLPFIAPDKFKPYDELKGRLARILGEHEQSIDESENVSPPTAPKGNKHAHVADPAEDEEDAAILASLQKLAEEDVE